MTATTTAPYVGKRRDITPLGLIVAAERDNQARYSYSAVLYVGRHHKAVA